MYDRDEDTDSDWTLFDSFMLACFILLGCIVGLSIAFTVMM